MKSEAAVAPPTFSNAAALRATPQVERVSLTERSDGKGYVIRFHTDGLVAAYSEPRMLADGQLEVILFNTRLASDHVRGDAAGPVIRYSGEEDEGHLFFSGLRLMPGNPCRLRHTATAAPTTSLWGLLMCPGRLLRTRRRVGTSDRFLFGRYRCWPRLPPISCPAIGGGTTGRTREALLASSREEAVPTGGQWLLDTVVIDAGHGGKDPGTKGPGILEKDITLAVSLKLGAYLKERLGSTRRVYPPGRPVYRTQGPGTDRQRTWGQAFHFDPCELGGQCGGERRRKPIFIGLHKTDAARSTMERENEVVKMESSQREYEDMNEEALIRMALTQSAYMQQSQETRSAYSGSVRETGATQEPGGQTGRFLCALGALPCPPCWSNWDF